MDNEKKRDTLFDDSWLDELLGPQDAGATVIADDQAAMDAGLVDPNDLELEKLLEEFGSEAAGLNPETPVAAEIPENSAPPAEAAPEEMPIVSANPVEAEVPFLDEEFRNTFGTG